jgi:hypothetical protein
MTIDTGSIDSTEEVDDDRPDQRLAHGRAEGPSAAAASFAANPPGSHRHRRASAVCCSGAQQKNVIHHDEY